MQCPYCKKNNVVSVEVIGPYLAGEDTSSADNIAKKVKYYCALCKKSFCDNNVILNAIKEIEKSRSLDIAATRGVSGFEISNKTGLAIPEIIDAIQLLEKNGHIKFVQVNRELMGIEDFGVRITE